MKNYRNSHLSILFRRRFNMLRAMRFGITFGVAVMVSLLTLSLFRSGSEKIERVSAALNVANACPGASSPYGVPLTADMLANLRIGPDVLNMAYRFRASQSGTIKSVRVYVKTGEGYSGGNGGTMRIDLAPDDSVHGHAPSLDTLGSAYAAELLSSPFNRVFVFEKPVSVSRDSYYYLVFSNAADKPKANFVSINRLVSASKQTPHVIDLSVLTRDSVDSAWSPRSGDIPIFALHYSDGAMQGQGYIDALSESGVFRVAGRNRVRERITVRGSDRIAKQFYVRVRNQGSSVADLNVVVEEEKGGIVARGDVKVDVGNTYEWVSCIFPLPLTLKSSHTYNIVLSSTSGVETFPLQGGVRYGFDVPTVFYEGRYEVNTGGRWIAPRRDLQLQFYLCG